MVRVTSRKSPSVAWNRAAARSTSAGGGVSLTKRRASLVAMKRAVAGSFARMSSTCSPSDSPPPALITCPSTTFCAGVVQPRVEREAAALPRVVDRPPREGARDLGHVLLRVAAVHAERVQLHQLAAVVLVETLGGVLALRPLAACRRGRPRARRTDLVRRAAAASPYAARSDPRSASCRGRTASPGSWRSPPADRGTCRARAVGSSRARTRSAGTDRVPCARRR